MIKKLLTIIATLFALVCMLSSCEDEIAANGAFPEEDCVMVYTISEDEYIRILWQINSDFCYYGEWVKEDAVKPVYLRETFHHGWFGSSGYAVYIDEFDPNEKDHFYSAECDKFMLDRGVLNSSYIINTETNEEIPITYSTESDLDFYFSWVSPTLITFKNTEGKIYKEQSLNFWYDFESQRGEWVTNGKTVPIKMEFSAVTPLCVKLNIYDVSDGRETLTLSSEGELTDENTLRINLSYDDYHWFVNQMFYEDTVSEITISRMDRE